MTEGNDDGSVSSGSSSIGGGSLVPNIWGSNAAATSRGEHHLVTVRAQVMMRDDNRGGWLPRGGGGLSSVSVMKRISPHHLGSNLTTAQSGHHLHHYSHSHHHPLHHHHQLEGGGGGSFVEFLIYGKKLNDQSVVLNCSINKDFEYNKVMPTFHHWRSGEHKFGLTFQTAADARAFDKGVREAVQELMDGLGDPSYFSQPPSSNPASSTGSANTPKSHCSSTNDEGPYEKEDIFFAVILPNANDESAPPPPVSKPPLASPTHLARFKPARPPKASLGLSDKIEDDKPQDLDHPASTADQYTYVQFAAPERSLPRHYQQQGVPQSGCHHEYYYPIVEVKKQDNNQQLRRDSIDSIKRANQEQQQIGVATTISSGGAVVHSKRSTSNSSAGSSSFHNLKLTNVKKEFRGNENKPFRGKPMAGLGDRAALKQRCRHCDETYYIENNPKGSCEYAPDIIRSTIDHLTCIGCAQCMLYHCMSDEEGEYLRHPCNCEGGCCFCCRGAAGDSALDNEMMGMSVSGNGSNSTVMGSNGTRSSCGKRWFALTLLSFLVPCLCCYLPLKACHSACVSCELCGGQHESYNNGRHCSGDKRDNHRYSLGKHHHLEGRFNSRRGKYGGRGSRFDAIGGS